MFEHMRLEDLSLFACYECGHHFYVLELPQGINDPNFCPYCGVTFEETFIIEDAEDDEDM